MTHCQLSRGVFFFFVSPSEGLFYNVGSGGKRSFCFLSLSVG